MSSHIPNITGLTNLQAAIKYAEAGLYVLPIKPGTKHPGSIVGKNWQQKSSRDPQQIADWYLDHPNAGVAIHAGRSGLLILDVDNPTNLPRLLIDALTTTPAPYQTTRKNDQARRHYIYKQPTGKNYGNGLGTLPKGWGDIRGEGGIILVEPSPHPDPEGEYKWGKTGEIPLLPETISSKLTPQQPTNDLFTTASTAKTENASSLTPIEPASSEEIITFINSHNQAGDTKHADAWVATYRKRVREGDSRHNSMIAILTGALKEARAGYYPAAYVEEHLRVAFLESFTQHPENAKPGVNHRQLTPNQAATEWAGILAWSVKQATTANLQAIVERAETHAPTLSENLTNRLTKQHPEPHANVHEHSHENMVIDPATGEIINPQNERNDSEPPRPSSNIQSPVSNQTNTTGETEATWAPINLTEILNGTQNPTQPTIGTRTDKQGLFYPGHIHSVYGESESGKSWIAQHTATNLITNGKKVAYIDFESDPHSITQRLKQLGATTMQLADQNLFKYIRPEASPTSFNETNAFARLCATPLDLIIIDGVTEALTLQARKTLDNDDITMWMRQIPKHLARTTGAAVILIDHVIKASEGRGRFPIGGQAKMAAIDGAAYYIEPLTALGAGLDGTLTVRVTKDRPGQVRAHAGAWSKKDRTQEAARFRIDSTQPGIINSWLEPPEFGEIKDNKEFYPAKLMESISKVLNTLREPISFSRLHELLKEKGSAAKRTTILDAVNRLIDGGFVIEKDGPRGARLLRSTGTYTARTDPKSTQYTADAQRFATITPIKKPDTNNPF